MTDNRNRILRIVGQLEEQLDRFTIDCKVCRLHKESLDQIKSSIDYLKSRIRHLRITQADSVIISQVKDQLRERIVVQANIYLYINQHLKNSHIE